MLAPKKPIAPIRDPNLWVGTGSSLLGSILEKQNQQGQQKAVANAINNNLATNNEEAKEIEGILGDTAGNIADTETENNANSYIDKLNEVLGVNNSTNPYQDISYKKALLNNENQGNMMKYSDLNNNIQDAIRKPKTSLNREKQQALYNQNMQNAITSDAQYNAQQKGSGLRNIASIVSMLAGYGAF